MLRLQAAGTRWLDLGGVATDQSPGIAHFKLGSGAALVRLSGTYF
jgi:lipid II:glycine glycyltransferase (peptidoglycan interpeptide bridge formation enzyme)